MIKVSEVNQYEDYIKIVIDHMTPSEVTTDTSGYDVLINLDKKYLNEEFKVIENDVCIDGKEYYDLKYNEEKNLGN